MPGSAAGHTPDPIPLGLLPACFELFSFLNISALILILCIDQDLVLRASFKNPAERYDSAEAWYYRVVNA